ncbi:TetR/AcrR family transcriptional regulator [Sandarakinorhabdus sp. AAP62]|uniref:TetR/AcrR family transcriptional regulator n=1 Tax=Sandarakinorhabdus sp. AAP62 TaxID=1248916 RepID=UPI000317B282|nr:TetR/AcrR family transcriptional regulator [Sandarakinorhabdus sp. AAP62]
MTTRPYVSAKREEKAQATRAAILTAFAEQLSEGNDRLSPSAAAARAGVSLRTVHVHFPNEESQIAALAEWLDHQLYPEGVVLCAGPDDLVRYFRDIHRQALKHPITRSLAFGRGAWRTVRDRRRVDRLAAIRQSVEAIGAPAEATRQATAMLLSLSGADASYRLLDHGLPLEQAPDVIANMVTLIVGQLRAQMAN